MSLSIEAQIARMREVWPEFELAGRDGQIARWRGPLRPLLQTYMIDILYRAPTLIERLDAALHQPRVSVVSPALRRRPGDREGALPHVYYGKDDVVSLCMLDPEAGDWSPCDHLAETTVPWTIEWLAAYEGWRATGTWSASGRHVEPAGAHG